MPAAYQLLPRARHHAVTLTGDDGSRNIDPLDPDVWEEQGWGLASTEIDTTLEWLLPDLPDAADRRRVARDHLHENLRRARQFTSQQYLRSPQEMTELFADLPEALAKEVPFQC